MGEAGPEAIMPLRRGADGSLGVQAQGGGSANVSVSIINNTTAQATTQETTDSRGNRKVEVIIGDMTAGEVTRSGSSSQKAMKSTYGIQPALIRR
jgi:phage-related minor tail protein